MTWLIVGGKGQLGKALSYVLAERSINYLAWGSKDLDIRSGSLCLETIESLAPSVIINAAAWTDVDGAESDSDGAHAVNATGALNLAIAAKAVDATFVQISTDYVFSGNSNSPWREDETPAPVSVYGATKAAGESAVLAEYSQGSYIIRTAWLYSPWGKNFAKTMTRLALSGEGEVQVANDQNGQPTSAIDLANQIVDSVIAKLPLGIYHATNSGQGTWFDFAWEIFNLAGASSKRVVAVDSSHVLRPAKRPAYSVLSHEGWSRSGSNGNSVAEMRDWRIALNVAMPAIISAVKAEG
jgi:dTDP-4-dehydrorhamnose reductase